MMQMRIIVTLISLLLVIQECKYLPVVISIRCSLIFICNSHLKAMQSGVIDVHQQLLDVLKIFIGEELAIGEKLAQKIMTFV